MGKIYKNSILYSGGGGSGTGGGHTIYDTDDTAMPQETGLQFKGLKVTDDSANSETDVEAFGLNNDSLDDVTSGSIPTGFIQPAFNYSTNEQIVGKWIDGKPLYQLTYTGTVTMSSNQQVVLFNLDSSLNIGTMVEVTGAINYSSNSYMPMNTNQSQIWINFPNVKYTDTGARTNAPYQVTLKYTKA